MEVASEAIDFDFELVSNDLQVPKQTEAAYIQDLSEPLRPGSCIVLRGTVRPQCKRYVPEFPI